MKQEITDKFIEIVVVLHSHSDLDTMMKKISNEYNGEIYIKQDANSTSPWGLTKKFRVKNFFKFLNNKYNETTSIKLVSEYILNPVKWLNSEKEYNEIYNKINKLLNIAGYEVNKKGIMQKVEAITTVKDINEKWESFSSELEEFKNKELINSEVLEFCKKEADKDFYYHVVDQVAKHLEEKIKNHLYLNIGDETKKLEIF